MPPSRPRAPAFHNRRLSAAAPHHGTTKRDVPAARESVSSGIHILPAAAQLFSAEAAGRIQFAVNPIVLQELLLTAEAAGRPEFEEIRDHLRILSVDYTKAEALLPEVRALRNRFAHSNDILIVSSAGRCDFLVTRDTVLKKLVTAEKPQVLTPEELVTQLRAA